jgi:hypothetical protein
MGEPSLDDRFLTLSRVRVTYRRGFGLDDWIYRTLYVRNSGLQALQLYRYSTDFTVHRCTRTSFFNHY